MFVFKVLLRIDFCLIALWSEKKLDMIPGFLKITTACFVTQLVICPGEFSVCT